LPRQVKSIGDLDSRASLKRELSIFRKILLLLACFVSAFPVSSGSISKKSTPENKLTPLAGSCLIRIMQFRDHPLMTRKSGFCSWPPAWTTTRHDKNDKLTGEVGTLQQVLTSYLTDTKLFMFIDYQGFRYLGLMAFDDTKFCAAIYTLLKSNVGRSIKDIGDLDLSYTL
jgi:hypothetical protein